MSKNCCESLVTILFIFRFVCQKWFKIKWIAQFINDIIFFQKLLDSLLKKYCAHSWKMHIVVRPRKLSFERYAYFGTCAYWIKWAYLGKWRISHQRYSLYRIDSVFCEGEHSRVCSHLLCTDLKICTGKQGSIGLFVCIFFSN